MIESGRHGANAAYERAIVLSSGVPTASRRNRVIGALAILLGLYALVHVLGIAELLEPESIRGVVASAGAWGPAVFGLILIGGVLAQIPGMVFLTAAPLLFPLGTALAVCLIAGNIAVNLNFALVRRVGGQSITRLEQPWAQRVFEQLEERPLRSVGILRVVLIMFPPLTGALALTPLDSRAHALASAVGMSIPIVAVLVIETLALS